MRFVKLKRLTENESTLVVESQVMDTTRSKRE